MHAKLPKREKLKMAAHLKVDPPTDSRVADQHQECEFDRPETN